MSSLITDDKEVSTALELLKINSTPRVSVLVPIITEIFNCCLVLGKFTKQTRILLLFHYIRRVISKMWIIILLIQVNMLLESGMPFGRLWVEKISKGTLINSGYTDFEKVVDTVNIQFAIRKLNFYGINGSQLNWIGSIRSNRREFVKIKDSVS